MSPLPPPTFYEASQHHHLLPQIAEIHQDCVNHDGMLATILDVSNTEKLLKYWESCHQEVVDGSRVLILQLAQNESGDEQVAGIVNLIMPWTETGPFRSFVEKLMVSPRHRRKGIARALMSTIEEAARKYKRELLMLDTTIGTEAEHVYPRFGYKVFGRLPKYGISPRDGSLVDEVFFYKDLRDEQEIKLS